MTVVFTTEEPGDLDGAMAMCASAADASALAQFVNKQGCASAMPMPAPDQRRSGRR